MIASGPRLPVLRVPLGPSPWAFRNRTVLCASEPLSLIEQPWSNSGDLSGITCMMRGMHTCVMVFDFQCYLRVLDDRTALAWTEIGPPDARRLFFQRIDLPYLSPLSRPHEHAAAIRHEKLGMTRLTGAQTWIFDPKRDAGVHQIDVPHEWSAFEETLVLSEHGSSNHFDQMSRAIFAFDWKARRVTVWPQDWFNQGSTDFGYQWIASVARRADGAIVGSGVRISPFELDATNRQLKQQLSYDPIYGSEL